MPKILIVEDDRSVREMLKTCLEAQGYMVLAAENGRTAIDWVREVRLDLAIVDLGLPDMNGQEVCSAIKGDPKTRSTQILILTGDVSNEARIRGDADLFLTKPLAIADLKKAVGGLLEKAQKRRLRPSARIN